MGPGRMTVQAMREASDRVSDAIAMAKRRFGKWAYLFANGRSSGFDSRVVEFAATKVGKEVHHEKMLRRSSLINAMPEKSTNAA